MTLWCSCGGVRAHSEAKWAKPRHIEQTTCLGMSSVEGMRTVEVSRELLTSFKGNEAPPACCWRKSWSYASQPRPGCFLASCMTIWANATISFIWGQEVWVTMTAKKQKTHVRGLLISLSLYADALGITATDERPRSCICCNRAALSG